MELRLNIKAASIPSHAMRLPSATRCLIKLLNYEFSSFSLFYREAEREKSDFESWQVRPSESRELSFNYLASQRANSFGGTLRMREDPESKPRSCFQVLSGGFLESRYADYGIVNVNYSRNVSGGTTTGTLNSSPQNPSISGAGVFV